MFLLLLLGCFSTTTSTEVSASTSTVVGDGCPRQCECKWKRGKEAVHCVEASGFYEIPKLQYSGTQVPPTLYKC